ncbi:D-alanyl-D-alanine carboxypeptidase [Seinonella peptonophila]|uniref:serine-type D-Ala-D-Ala carboxypeptidase n=1 Tax=Seinonella peptonophila TaxID=112248 RepID=A0A1M4TIV9_9BACL|nr:D-alanyl-D-alanine carboxypeptidase family protein [Seinonella peptonophila]SHE44345.1 D-alanyl-D-alanine carboxypeptidase [Seinonella peptonophila]
MKKWIIALVCFVICFGSVKYVKAAKPEVSAETAILYDMDTKKILFQKHADQKMKIASITKIMTAILAIERGKLDQPITINGRAVGVEGSSIYLKVGQKIPLRALLYGLMLRSGNDAAVAIAEAIGGSVDGFVYLMNQKAEQLGMSNSHFANPHGLDSENHYSSAYDMAILTTYAMKHPVFQEIVKSKVAKFDWPGQDWQQVFRNKNKFLTLYPASDGVKTGFTKKAGRTLVTTAKKGKHHLVCVTLRASDDWNDHRNLYEYGFQKLSTQAIPQGEKILNTSIFNRNKQQLQIITQQPFAYPIDDQEKRQLRIQPMIAYPLQTVHNSNEVVGHLRVFLHGQYLGAVPLISSWSDPPSFVYRWKEVFLTFLVPGRGGFK